MSLPRSGLVFWCCLLVLGCVVVCFGGLWLVCLSGSGSFLLAPFIEFTSGDLCLSAHTAPSPVQKKKVTNILGRSFTQPTSFLIFIPHMNHLHEYGRRVGMVPRSSLKEGKSRQMVGKEQRPQNQPKTIHPSPQAETPPSCSLSSTLGETCETETSGN